MENLSRFTIGKITIRDKPITWELLNRQLNTEEWYRCHFFNFFYWVGHLRSLTTEIVQSTVRCLPVMVQILNNCSFHGEQINFHCFRLEKIISKSNKRLQRHILKLEPTKIIAGHCTKLYIFFRKSHQKTTQTAKSSKTISEGV